MIEKVSSISPVHDRAADPFWSEEDDLMAEKFSALMRRQDHLQRAVKNAWRCITG